MSPVVPSVAEAEPTLKSVLAGMGSLRTKLDAGAPPPFEKAMV